LDISEDIFRFWKYLSKYSIWNTLKIRKVQELLLYF